MVLTGGQSKPSLASLSLVYEPRVPANTKYQSLVK